MPPLSRPPEVRVLVLGDDPLARGGLALLIGETGEAIVAGQRAPADAREAMGSAEVDAVLWDLGTGGREATPLGELRELSGEGVPIVVLAADESAAAEALAAGARGVLPRDADRERLAAALRAAARRLIVIDEAFAAVAPARPPGLGAETAAELLTPRELEVLQLLSEGLPNKLIAARLGISDHTAKFHVNAILGKLGVQSRTEAVVRAARLGLVAL